MQQDVARAGIEGVRVCPSRYESGGEGVVVLGDVIGGEVGGVKLDEGQPQGTVSCIVAQVKVHTAIEIEVI